MKKLPVYKTVVTFPHPAKLIENTWITLADGTRLAARIWMPADAEGILSLPFWNICPIAKTMEPPSGTG